MATTLHVRDVPEDTIATLKIRAAQSGQSLQAYVRHLLDREASMLTNVDAAAKAEEIAERSAVTADDVIAAIEDARRGRT